MSIKILKEIKELIKREFSHVIISDPVIIRRKLRILLDDGSFVEIRYTTVREYSLHWQKGSRIIRIDTAPHHRNLKSFSRHIHFKSEDHVIEDNITDLKSSPIENAKKFLKFILEMREKI
ncbi:MAG: toxin-antitoxin system TumE family protein [Candidatus Baldrarchaeia archaeon]